MNNKGFLLAEQVVKIVIALIVLGFLIYFLTSLYFSGKEIELQKKAEGYLTGRDGVQEILDNMTGGETKELTHKKDLPEGWYLFSFTGAKKPAPCGIQNCICVCENVVVYFWSPDRQAKYCGESGACITVKGLKKNVPELEIELVANNPPTLVITKDVNGGVSIKQKKNGIR